MPWTAPNPKATAATPITAPLATGAMPSASAGTDRYTANNSATTSMPLAIESRTAARSILARASTAKTPGPLNFNCTAGTPRVGASRTAAANAARMASMARSCASVSDPRAAVSATANARFPSAEAHTPSIVEGAGVRCS